MSTGGPVWLLEESITDEDHVYISGLLSDFQEFCLYEDPVEVLRERGQKNDLDIANQTQKSSPQGSQAA